MFESLSIREMEVLGEVVKCKPDRDIANQLFVSIPTIKSHLSSIYAKLGLSGQYARMNLIRLYFENKP